MPNNNAEESLIPARSNSWKNCSRYKKYHRFNKDQFYEGEFFRDCIHGQGIYKWKDFAVYEGGFYSNLKEGYASLSFPDNSYFEGLFIKNEPFGPGILTYANGRQDAGFWMGRKLIRLSRAVDYIIPRLASTSAAKIKLLQFKRFLPLNEEFYDSTTDIMERFGYPPINFPTPFSNMIYDRRSIFFDKHIFDITYFINVQEFSEEFLDSKVLENGIRKSVELLVEGEDSSSLEEIRIPSHCLCQQDEFVMSYESADGKDICEKESIKGEVEVGILAYFTKLRMTEGLEENEDVEEAKIFQQDGEEKKDESKSPKILLWNRSDLCREILKHMFRYRGFEEKLNFNLAKLMLGSRTAFRKTGEKEKQCLQLLKMCSLGPPHAVKDLLCSYEISHNLMDGRGNNSLMFAAATDQHEIMDILLDYGFDVNNFNDEGLTPLNLCLLRRLALTNNISSWETAFLPQEVDKSLFPDDIQEEEFQAFQSISSLDRIFGDGMSANHSKTFIHNRFLALLPTPSFLKDSSQSISLKTQDFYDSFEGFNLSQITILDLLRSPKTYSLMTLCADGSKNDHKVNSFCSFQTIDSSRKIESNEPTPSINIKTIVPKTIKKDEFVKSLQRVSTDRYLFDFTFKKNSNAEKVKKEKEGLTMLNKGKNNRAPEKEKQEKKEEEMDEEHMEELNRKLFKIDKTIEKLLKRGADPNISEVPKPSIHLGIHTKDLNTIKALLLFGANPDYQLYANEGLLTPLHVIALKELDQKNVEICEMLLQFGANPEVETAPEFEIFENDKILLNSDSGRTPLQLLCMRPDLDSTHSNDNLAIACLLGSVSNKRHFYNGHSCLTLAMLCNNFQIFKVLLEYFDPNDILGNDRGTALHVLVSTELQRITPYENSIKMCDLLISKGADPLKKFKNPVKLFGTCVDYGYREIEEEKKARKVSTPVKKEGSRGDRSGKKKSVVADYLKDHERVVEYLAKIASNMAKNKNGDINVKNSSKAKNKDLEEVNERNNKDAKGKDRSRGKDSVLTESRESKEISSAKSEAKKDYSEVEKIKKEFFGKLETTEKKENERKFKNDRENWEDGRDLNKEKKKKQKDVDKDFYKVKPPEKKESEKSKGRERHKIETGSSDKIKKDCLKGCRRSNNWEKFPEKIRQTIFQMYGNRFDIDINELLVPYVVLRNGELYYRFHKKSTCEKEQYSLI